MSKSTKKKSRLKIKKNSLLGKFILVGILLVVVLNLLRYAAYFKKEDNSIIKVIIQNDVDIELDNDVYIDENGIIYFSEDDMKKYFDEDLYYEKDSQNMRIYFSMAQNKILQITENENHMYVNGSFIKIRGKVLERNGIYYFPISELTSVYNLEVDYLPDTNKINIEKLSEEKTVAVVNRDIKLKYKMTDISRTVRNLAQGETVTIIKEMNKKWVKVKTSDYMIGYVKKSKLLDFTQERKKLDLDSQYFTDFNLDTDFVVMPDESIYENFEQKISTYDGRTEVCQELSKKISQTILKENIIDKNIGIKIDYDNIENKENFYKFLEQLKIYSNSNGCFLIVVNKSGLDSDKLNRISDVVI